MWLFPFHTLALFFRHQPYGWHTAVNTHYIRLHAFVRAGTVTPPGLCGVFHVNWLVVNQHQEEEMYVHHFSTGNFLPLLLYFGHDILGRQSFYLASLLLCVLLPKHACMSTGLKHKQYMQYVYHTVVPILHEKKNVMCIYIYMKKKMMQQKNDIIYTYT